MSEMMGNLYVSNDEEMNEVLSVSFNAEVPAVSFNADDNNKYIKNLMNSIPAEEIYTDAQIEVLPDVKARVKKIKKISDYSKLFSQSNKEMSLPDELNNMKVYFIIVFF